MLVNFQNERPSSLDAYPGSSHKRVADAIEQYIVSDHASKIIGLDGEFGSGKSTILHMLSDSMCSARDGFKVWFFDCEKNYQGSIKSNFVSLFSEEIIERVGGDVARIEKIKDSRDTALGRKLSYTRDTSSKVSGWAVALLVSVFFSSAFLKGLVTALGQKDEVVGFSFFWWLFTVAAVLSPMLVMLIAYCVNREKVKSGEWSILNIFKGDTRDRIRERIEIAKDVSPIDLRNVLESHLRLVSNIRYVVVIDNFDRLPHDQLRGVWSDLEVFTDASHDLGLTVIVPFCSARVAQLLSESSDSDYGAKEFISKKFPVVFRTPPVISSGWKETFRKFWGDSFEGGHYEDVVDCAAMLERHNPVSGGALTPRVQKRFINDIAAGLLLAPEKFPALIIAAYVAMCRYKGVGVRDVLSVDLPVKYTDEERSAIKRTRALLDERFGSDPESGWQIKLLQVHYQTSAEIALAELIDVPLHDSVEELNGSRFSDLSGIFGFEHAFRRLLEGVYSFENLLITLHGACLVGAQDVVEKYIGLVNSRLRVVGFVRSDGEYGSKFFEALEYLSGIGMEQGPFSKDISSLRESILEFIDQGYDAQGSSDRVHLVELYDSYCKAFSLDIDEIEVEDAGVLLHDILPAEDLECIGIGQFSLTKSGESSAVVQLCSSSAVTFDVVPLESGWNEYLCQLFSAAKLGDNSNFESAFPEGSLNAVVSMVNASPLEERFWLALSLCRSFDASVDSSLASLVQMGEASIVKVYAAVICIRLKKFSMLASYPKISESISMDFEVFKVVCCLGVTASDLMDAMSDEGSRPLVERLFLELLSSRRISKINVSDVLARFDVLYSCAQAGAIPAADLLSWIDMWSASYPEKLLPVSGLSGSVFSILEETDGGKIYQFFLSHFCEQARSEEEWVELLQEESVNADLLVALIKSKNGKVAYPAVLRDAILSCLEAMCAQGSISGDRSLERLASVSSFVKGNASAVFSANLRAIALRPGDAEVSCLIVKAFGGYISIFKPDSLGEREQLIRILEFVAGCPKDQLGVIGFLESKASQFDSFEFEGDYAISLASIVRQLELYLPELNKVLARKPGVLSRLKSAVFGEAQDSLSPKGFEGASD